MVIALFLTVSLSGCGERCIKLLHTAMSFYRDFGYHAIILGGCLGSLSIPLSSDLLHILHYCRIYVTLLKVKLQ